MSKKSDMLDEYDFSKGERGPVISHKGKTRITIFIDTDVLEWFRDEAEREGQGYQTAINQALRNYIKQDKRSSSKEESCRKFLRRRLCRRKEAICCQGLGFHRREYRTFRLDRMSDSKTTFPIKAFDRRRLLYVEMEFTQPRKHG